ncbi:DUF4214 domain-containing protein [Aquihabitans sp. McL0605]|uniref:DUF4214 domain-containing protein n=1 Tax=Aquihabitans sp. McL0605 TaxID=3415671 RepID=UPI003CEC1DE0
MSIRRFVAVGLGLSLLAPLAAAGGAGAEPAGDTTVNKAQTWLLTQQQADGGFEVSGFAGFETPDAVLALAASSQGGDNWSANDARDAIASLDNGTGKDPLDALDKLAEASLVPGNAATDPTNNAGAARAAKLIALVAAPLGIDATDFDPSNDSATPVDLAAVLEAHKQVDGSYALGALFNGLLYVPIALEATNTAVPAGLVAQIKAGQRADGSWDYTGTPTGGPGEDVDTTALALDALASSDLTTTDAAVKKGVQFLAAHQQANGSWQAFGSSDPNSTSTATVALSDLHIDTTTSGWRTTYGTPSSGTYVSPQAWLRTQQAVDGHINSQNDSPTFGTNTFATTQTVQALSRQRFLTLEREQLVRGYSERLASPAAAPDPNLDGAHQLASDAVGPNTSIKAARVAAATAVVAGQDSREAAVEDLFQQAFHRSVDPSGRSYWAGKLITLSRPEVLSRLTGSSEYFRKAGGTIPKFVDAVYQSVLGRAADASGRAYWIGQLNQGKSVERVARSLVASTEYRRHVVNDAFDRVLDRVPTSGERSYWITRIATTRVEVLLATLAASDEFYGSLTS